MRLPTPVKAVGRRIPGAPVPLVGSRPHQEGLYDSQAYLERSGFMRYGQTAAGFKTVKVSKQKLLNRLKENRDKHKREFEKAFAGYQQAFLEQAKVLMEVAQQVVEEGKRVELVGSIDLQVPEDHTKDYDAAISMVDWNEVDEGEKIELSFEQFMFFVEDKWNWRKRHVGVFNAYSAPAGLGRAPGFDPMRRFTRPVGADYDLG